MPHDPRLPAPAHVRVTLSPSPPPPFPVACASGPPGPAATQVFVHTPWRARLKSTAWTVFLHARHHTGVGIICSVAYFDPGNWGVDLQAGSQYGYKLLFVVLLSGLFAVVLQVLASRLGCVTGLDLAQHCRLLLYSRPSHPRLFRWALLYPLYALSELAIVATDLAELLGSAIALALLFPALPLWAGVLITGADVLLLLALGDPLGGRPAKAFEWLIALLVLTVLISMAIIIARVPVNWSTAFAGFAPSKTVFKSGGLYTSIGILGATVMPHSIFLGSALATQDRTPPAAPGPSKSCPGSLEDGDGDAAGAGAGGARPWAARLAGAVRAHVARALHFRIPRPGRAPSLRAPGPGERAEPRSHAEHANNALSFVRAHVHHGVADMVLSLLGLAVVINAMILVLASAVFFYGSGAGSGAPASLFDAHALIRELVGKPAALLFALALLASGQSASIVATLAGQCVAEGFMRWRVSPLTRRLLTRLLSLAPAAVVAASTGRAGLNTLLVASQVALALVLPAVIAPLVWFTSRRGYMCVGAAGEGGGRGVDFRSGPLLTGAGVLIFAVICLANGYVVVTLVLGYSG